MAGRRGRGSGTDPSVAPQMVEAGQFLTTGSKDLISPDSSGPLARRGRFTRLSRHGPHLDAVYH